MCLSLAGRVLDVDADGHEAVVDLDGSTRRISLAVLTLDGRTPAPGDWVLVHTGLAVDVLTEEDAHEILATHRAMHEAGGTDG